MKRLVCEMCGGTDLLKDGGVFVCQSCGCKYTVEEAKKMMIDGTVRVEGTVTIDNSSKIENLLLNAKRAFEDSKFSQAQELFGQVLNEDPNNETAILYEGLAIGWQGNTVRYTIDKARDAAIRALDIAFSNNGGTDSFEVFVLETFTGMDALGTALITMCVNYQVSALQEYKNTIENLEYRRKRMDVVYGDFEGLKRELNYAENKKDEDVKKIDNVLFRTLDLMMDVFRKSISFCGEGYFFRDITLESMKEALEHIINMECWKSNKVSDLRKLQSAIEGIRIEREKAKKEKYWLEHQDEKDAYEAELIQQRERIKAYLGDDLFELRKKISLLGCVLYAGNYTTIGLTQDGRVLRTGKNHKGKYTVDDWVEIDSVAIGDEIEYGIKLDGSVISVGEGISDVSSFQDIVGITNTLGATYGLKKDGTVMTNTIYHGVKGWENWTDIVCIKSNHISLFGLRIDGSVVVSEDKILYDYGQCKVDEWTNIIDIVFGSYFTVGLRCDGTVVATGENSYRQCDVNGWTDIVSVAAGLSHTVGLKSDGTVVVAGVNVNGGCQVSEWKGIVSIKSSSQHTVGLRIDGTVVATGDNRFGQCDVGGWTDIVSIVVGEEHTVGLKSDGSVVVTGGGNYAHNVEGWQLFDDLITVIEDRERKINERRQQLKLYYQQKCDDEKSAHDVLLQKKTSMEGEVKSLSVMQLKRKMELNSEISKIEKKLPEVEMKYKFYEKALLMIENIHLA